MEYVGGPGVVIGDTKILTNSNQIDTKLCDEIGRRNWRHGFGLSENSTRLSEGMLEASDHRVSERDGLVVELKSGE